MAKESIALENRDIRLVVFDLDGTTAETFPDLAASLNHLVAKYGDYGDVGPVARNLMGRGARWLLEHLYEKLGITAGSFEQDQKEYFDYYTEHCYEHTYPYKNTISTFAALREHGIHVAMATMKMRCATEVLMDRLGFAPYVETWMAQEDMAEPKPSGWCVRECARRLGVGCQNTAMVGDSVLDIGAARDAGAMSIAVMGGYYDQAVMRDIEADYKIEEIGEVPGIVI